MRLELCLEGRCGINYVYRRPCGLQIDYPGDLVVRLVTDVPEPLQNGLQRYLGGTTSRVPALMTDVMAGAESAGRDSGWIAAIIMSMHSAAA
jgi:hypothetical protein